MITKEQLIKQMDRVRVLETDFPVYSPDGVVRERKCHRLLTYTPHNLPMADEKYALSTDQIRELFGNIYEYVNNSTAKKPRKNRRVK